MILPGATLGMLGGGQLGRMFTVAARNMGYEVVVLDPDPHSPAGKLATEHLCAAYDDAAALTRLEQTCAAITTEFENIPAAILETLAANLPVRPGARAVTITQDRSHEKTFLRDNGFPTAPFAIIRADADLTPALTTIPAPAILKVSRFGYDGKGQYSVAGEPDLKNGWAALGGNECVLEQRVPLDAEISVVLARSANGETVTFPVGENSHVNGILDVSIVPARVDAKLCQQAVDMAIGIADALEYVGVMAVEFFVSGGKLLVNEIAPRPHNSGHYTLDATATSQFEQQVRAVCGLPLGDTRLLSPVVMVNMLGDLWHGGRPPKWEKLLSHPNVKLHLYGKHEARPGRKMGHFNVLADKVESALDLARSIQQQLSTPD
ncbi:MAG: 5-(carboxyamino)imidazole ribonucleotide synthase [Gammaproteobacteria bacterium]|nr:5-(carboxyamino)imidazole ribonucleotide synthase [Gammaproteobacteria bacterium]MDH5653346.1 5-(carboxyamino)imidazole ribonucleotide synthase [Gammaproteobacteria bacterium]